MQYVEKRIVRPDPKSLRARVRSLAMGIGANSWIPVIKHARLADATWATIPWPSELVALNVGRRAIAESPPIAIMEGKLPTLICTLPRNSTDVKFLNGMLITHSPVPVVLDQHPASPGVDRPLPWLTQKGTTWGWAVDAASRGEPQAREREIFASSSMSCDHTIYTVPFSTFDAKLPTAISDYTQQRESSEALHGPVHISAQGHDDVSGPPPPPNWGR